MPGAPPCRVIAFHAQQCAEKYLKAYLVFHAIDSPYTHNLRRLLDFCAARASWAEQLRDAEELNPYASTARYPGEDLEVNEGDAHRALEIAGQVKEVITDALREKGFQAGPAGNP